MTKAFAALVALLIVLAALVLSMVFLWGITKQVLVVCRKHHATALRHNADRLAEGGYLEAAEQFRAYAELLEASPEQRRKLGYE